jgi:hypothetical protein
MAGEHPGTRSRKVSILDFGQNANGAAMRLEHPCSAPLLALPSVAELLSLQEYAPGLSRNGTWSRRVLAGMHGEEASEGRCGAIGCTS